MSGHTPGPWKAVGNSWEVSTVYDANGLEVAECHINPEADEESQEFFEAIMDANARLIAAAPDLLEALDAIEGRVEEAAKWRHNAQDWVGEEGWEPGLDLWDWIFKDVRDALAKARAGE